MISSDNPKMIYKYASSRLDTPEHLSALVDENGALVADDYDKAELLRRHFASSYPNADELSSRNQRPGPPLNVTPDISYLDSVDTSASNLSYHLAKLKNSSAPSPDDIPAAFLKLCGYEVCVPLSIIFERTFQYGDIPDVFRRALVVPIHKKGDRTKVENKRNVSLTSAACKLFGSVIADAVLSNASRQNLLCPEQFGYRPKYSCTLQLLCCLHDYATFLNNNDAFDIIFFDFKSAFELTTHDKLLECLPSLGVGPKIVQWFRSFLSGRSFRVLCKHTRTIVSVINALSPRWPLPSLRWSLPE